MSDETFRERVYDVVSHVPCGKVITYGAVARKAGSPFAARAVGTIMHHNPDTKRVPCHRVVCSDGRVGGYAFGTQEKIKKLQDESVEIVDGRVLAKYVIN